MAFWRQNETGGVRRFHPSTIVGVGNPVKGHIDLNRREPSGIMGQIIRGFSVDRIDSPTPIVETPTRGAQEERQPLGGSNSGCGNGSMAGGLVLVASAKRSGSAGKTYASPSEARAGISCMRTMTCWSLTSPPGYSLSSTAGTPPNRRWSNWRGLTCSARRRRRRSRSGAAAHLGRASPGSRHQWRAHPGQIRPGPCRAVAAVRTREGPENLPRPGKWPGSTRCRCYSSAHRPTRIQAWNDGRSSPSW